MWIKNKQTREPAGGGLQKISDRRRVRKTCTAPGRFGGGETLFITLPSYQIFCTLSHNVSFCGCNPNARLTSSDSSCKSSTISLSHLVLPLP